MMLPPDGVGEILEGAPYDIPRGDCPRCGSTEVIHLVIGMPTGPEAMVGPDWVKWFGCVHPGYERSCQECGLEWIPGPEGTGMTVNDWTELMRLADGDSDDDVANWISDHFELWAWEVLEPEGHVIGIDRYGTLIEFPLTLDEFWERVSNLEETVLAEMALESDDKG
jgi:hypothetical protein